MAALHRFTPGGYAYLEGGFPYSQGVIALPGHRIVRARLLRALPVRAAFDAIAAHLSARGRPLTALCAAELRSPEPFSLQGFKSFNQPYVQTLRDWGASDEGRNPVARSNVCPLYDPPAEPVFHAFCYTVEGADGDGAGGAFDYVVAGSGEWPEHTPFPEGVIARGDLSADGLARKARYVMDTMRSRVDGLAGEWSRLTGAHVYTVHDIHALIAPLFAPAGLTGVGLEWQVCAPPIRELAFEMDLRSLASELVLG